MNIRYHFEKSYPILISLFLIFIIIYFNLFKDKLSEFVIDLSNNAMSVSVTLFGFLLTILTLINSIETRRMKVVRDMGAFPRLMRYLKNSIILNLIVLVLSFFVKYAINNDLNSIFILKNYNLLAYSFIFIFIYSLLSSFRFTKIFIDTLTDK